MCHSNQEWKQYLKQLQLTKLNLCSCSYFIITGLCILVIVLWLLMTLLLRIVAHCPVIYFHIWPSVNTLCFIPLHLGYSGCRARLRILVQLCIISLIRSFLSLLTTSYYHHHHNYQHNTTVLTQEMRRIYCRALLQNWKISGTCAQHFTGWLWSSFI